VENPVLEESGERNDMVTFDMSPAEEPAPSPDAPEYQKLIPNQRGAGDAGDDEHTHPQKPFEITYDKLVESYSQFSYGPTIKITNEEFPTIENTVSKKPSLSEHLIWQLQMGNFTAGEREIGLRIICNLSDDGYFQETTTDEIANGMNIPVEEAESVLRRIQEFDPVGVGARDLKECLTIQAKTFVPDNALLLAVIENHLTNLEKRNYQKIARDLKCQMEVVAEIVKIIGAMEPKPGRSYSSEESYYLTPDVYVFKVGDEFVVSLNEDGLPKLKISTSYQDTLSKNPTKEVRSYIQDKFRSAVWLIKSIHQRQSTIKKVSESIVRFQREFFDRGVSYLRPLILKDVADDIGMHESTVSRVTTNKYMHTPHGIFELKYFFNSRISGTYGEDVASESVKASIRKIISGEDPVHPYSDQQIVDLLEKESIHIARRTIAKYREMMGILPSSRRKNIFHKKE